MTMLKGYAVTQKARRLRVLPAEVEQAQDGWDDWLMHLAEILLLGTMGTCFLVLAAVGIGAFWQAGRLYVLVGFIATILIVGMIVRRLFDGPVEPG